MYRSSPLNRSTLAVPAVSARTAPAVQTSLWLRLGLTLVAILLSAEFATELVSQPLLSALEETQSLVSEEVARSPSIQPVPEPVVCEQRLQQGLPPVPRWVAGWAR